MRTVVFIALAALIVITVPPAAFSDTSFPTHEDLFSNRSVISSGAVSLALLPTKVDAGNGSTRPIGPKASSTVTQADGLALLGLGLLATAGLLRRRLTSQAPLRTSPSRQASLSSIGSAPSL